MVWCGVVVCDLVVESRHKRLVLLTGAQMHRLCRAGRLPHRLLNGDVLHGIPHNPLRQHCGCKAVATEVEKEAAQELSGMA